MVRKVQLNATKQNSAMFSNLKQMRHDTELCDFIIKAGHDEYHAHKAILAAGSPYFKAMLRHNTKESQDGKVDMQFVDFECVKSCINSLYDGELDIPDGKIAGILHAADIMQLQGIKEAVSEIVGSELNAQNFYETRSMDEKYNLSDLLSNCNAFHEQNILTISAQPGFENEEKAHLMAALQSGKLTLDEKDKLAVCVRWAGGNRTKSCDLHDLIGLIKLRLIPVDFLSDLLAMEPSISNDLTLYKLISTPLLNIAKKSNEMVRSHYKETMVFFDDISNSLCSYDPASGETRKCHNAKFKDLTAFCAISVDSSIYILGKNQSLHQLDIATKNENWQKLQDTIIDHGSYPPTAYLRRSLYIVGSSCEQSKIVEKFDLDAQQWLRLTDKPCASQSATLVSLEDSMYCIGGKIRGSSVKALSKFTPSSSTAKWAGLAAMKIARHSCGAAAVGKKIFIMGGTGRPNEAIKEGECYDGSSGQWSSISPMIYGIKCCLSHHVDGWIYAAGFHGTSVHKYDIVNNKWSSVPASPCSIYDFVLARF